MTVQRKRGQKAIIFPEKMITDRRNHERIVVADMDNPIPFKGSFIPARSLRAEVPGQQEVDVYTVQISHKIPGIGLYSVVRWRDQEWDVDRPLEYRHGTRQTRHYTMDIRARPGVTPEESEGDDDG